MTGLPIKTRDVPAWLLACGLLVSGCADPVSIKETRSAIVSEIHIVSHGWHAGIAIRRADIPESIWPEKRDFPDAEYLEIGWGDREYYQATSPGLFTALKAALWPSDSVLHVAAFQGPVSSFFPRQQIKSLPVTREGMSRLLDYIERSFARTDHQPLEALGVGHYGDSRFYAARYSFYLFSNCNRWVARALRAAGYDVHDVITVGSLFTQLEKINTVNSPLRHKDGVDKSY